MQFRKLFIGIFILSNLFSCKDASDSELIPLQNVLVIVGDDHANHVLGSLGNKIIRTPNLDKLSSQGMLFSNAYANAPLCSASRQSLLTGKYPHAAGVTLLTTPFPEEQITLADHLKDYGYKSAIIGKNHFNNQLNHGFDIKIEKSDYLSFLEQNPPGKIPDTINSRPVWKPFRDHARIWLNSEALPSDHFDIESIGTYYANQAVNFISQNSDNPFFLWVGFHEPHSPFNFPIEYAGSYSSDKMILPEGSVEDDAFIPLVFKDLTEEERKGIISAYYTSVEYLDKNIGIILNGLEKSGLAENTLVIYLGDHGYLLNHHKRFEKHMMWEESVKAPLIIRAGKRPPIANRSDALVEFVDIVPTITELIEVPIMEGIHGESLAGQYSSFESQPKELVFSEFLADNKAMVRDNKWKYIYSSGKHDLAQGYATGNPATGVQHRLYELVSDPKETKNVAAENIEVVSRLQKEMIRLFMETHPKANELPEGLDIEGQLEWFCIPPEGEADLNIM